MDRQNLKPEFRVAEIADELQRIVNDWTQEQHVGDLTFRTPWPGAIKDKGRIIEQTFLVRTKDEGAEYRLRFTLQIDQFGAVVKQGFPAKIIFNKKQIAHDIDVERKLKHLLPLSAEEKERLFSDFVLLAIAKSTRDGRALSQCLNTIVQIQ